MTDEQLAEQFQLIEDSFNQALTTNNAVEISKYISDDWVLLTGQFGITGKERFLQVIEDGSLSHTAMKKKVLRVKLYNQIAIVTARGMNTGFYNDERYNSEHWVTDVYKKENKNWICIMSHETPVSCK